MPPARDGDEDLEMKAVLTRCLDRGRAAAVGLGPYAAVALLVPGGTVLAGLAWLYRHRKTTEIRS